MIPPKLSNSLRVLVVSAMLAGTPGVMALNDVTQPGDPIVASSDNSPGSEGAANAIDNAEAKYLNRDSANDAVPSGFVVSPSVGLTRVVGMTIQSANDAPDRDPKVVTLQGSNAETAPAWDDAAAWTDIATWSNIPSWVDTFPGDDRFQTQTFMFDNLKPYLHYRWALINTQGPSTCCMQIAEVELLGSVVPQDVTQPGDPIVASSDNSPGSEGAANAIDNAEAKYLNRDSANDAVPSGFVVSPSVGRTLVVGMTIESANDAPDRDPKVVTLQGSNAIDAPAWDDAAAWDDIVTWSDIPSWVDTFPGDDRFQVQTLLFDNVVPYRHYRWALINTQGPSTCCMQIAEVELLGTGAPVDVTQPSDLIVASSDNSPGSEGAANAIDNAEAKYLNRDSANDAVPSGFVVTPAVGASTVIGMTIQSANDAPDRDPKVVTLQGSNAETAPAWDDAAAWEDIVTIDAIPSWVDTFPGDDRFQWQEFYFPNQQSYLHYRWALINTQGPSTCCMQIAEVELLAVQEKADCTQARFVRRPVDVPVLSGETATFQIRVNGPWPLQWYLNGSPIPGATKDVYTTGPITAANTDDEYTVEIVGCEISDPVKAVVFTPSTVKSIGLSFDGEGANGAPTVVQPVDIAGVHLQAYWNTTDQGSVTAPLALVDSDNAASTVTATFTTSGEWGAGTGNVTPTQRLLNGLVYDNPGGQPANITFQNVPAGSHSIIAYTVGIPLQFQDQDYTVIGSTTKSIYTRQMNSDQYKASPGFVRGTSPDPNVRTLANYVRFDQIAPAGDGTIRLEWSTATTGFDRGVAINAIQLLIDPPYLGEPPTLVQSPEPTETLEGSTVALNSLASGDNLTYQWSKDGIELSNGGKISGAQSPTLNVKSFTAADEGYYTVSVVNAVGSVVSDRVKVKIVPAERAITDNLVTYFKFDESTGTTAANSGSDGTASNGIVDTAGGGPSGFKAGLIGNAYYNDLLTFVKVNDYTKFTEEGTVATWVNVNSRVATYNQDVQFVRNAHANFAVQNTTDPSEQFEFGLDWDDAVLGFHLFVAIGSGPNTATAREPGIFPLDEWQHVAFTIDGGQLRLYRNGEVVGVSDYFNGINAGDLAWLTIGSRADGLTSTPPSPADYPNVGPLLGSEQTLEGLMDDLAIWTFAWPQSVIQSIYDQGQSGQPLTSATLPDLPLPPTEGPAMSTEVLAGGGLRIAWEGTAGVLETSSAVDGSWSEVTGATNPYDITSPSEAGAFYRVRVD